MDSPKTEAYDVLIRICRAGRAGRNLRLVAAFAEIEADLIAQRDLPPPAEGQADAQPTALEEAA